MTVFTYPTVEQVLFIHLRLIAETGGSPYSIDEFRHWCYAIWQAG
jgi:hypothetical protein